MSLTPALIASFWALCGAARAAPASGPAAWSLPPAALTDLCDDAIRRADSSLATVAAVPLEARDFANTPEALETALQDLEDAVAPVVLMGYVAVSSETRGAGGQCRDRLDAFAQKNLARLDLYRALTEYASRNEPLTGEKRRLLERELEDWRNQGAGLNREARFELSFTRERLAASEQSFLDNLAWPRPRLLFSPDELAGLPQGVLQALPRQGRLMQVDAEPEAYQAFMSAVRDPAARQRMEFLFHNRAAATNAPVLKDLLALRGRVAALLGMKSSAHLALAGGLVPEPGRVRAILEDLARRLRPQAKTELADLTSLLRQDSGPRSKAKLQAWDRGFYIARQRGSATTEAPTLASEAVVDGVFMVVQRLFALRISRVRAAAAWREDAAFYEVRDAQSNELLGSFYLDLYARPGKAERSGVFVLSGGRVGADGAFQPGVCALWDSWPRRAGVAEMEGLFHGLGHVLAALLSRPRYARFAGAALPPDVAEAPALLLSRLAWRPEIAAAVSGRRWGPEVLVAESRRRAAGWPLAALDDTALALADLDVREGDPDAGGALRRRLERQGLDPVTRGTHPEASAQALVQDGAGATARVLAPLLAEELWRRWDEEGLFNPEAGRHLRETLFAAGSGDAGQAVRNFLGREPGFDVEPEPVQWPAGAAPDAEGGGPPWRRRLLR